MTLLEKQLKKERELRRVQEGKGKEQEKRAKRMEAQLAELEGEMTKGVGSLSGSSLRRVRRLLKAAPSTKSSPKRDEADAAMKAAVRCSCRRRRRPRSRPSRRPGYPA